MKVKAYDFGLKEYEGVAKEDIYSNLYFKDVKFRFDIETGEYVYEVVYSPPATNYYDSYGFSTNSSIYNILNIDNTLYNYYYSAWGPTTVENTTTGNTTTGNITSGNTYIDGYGLEYRIWRTE